MCPGHFDSEDEIQASSGKNFKYVVPSEQSLGKCNNCVILF